MAKGYDDEDDTGSERRGIVRTVIDITLKPFRVATSKPAQRAYLTTFLIVSTSSILFGLATVAYLLFYWSYIPRIGFERPIHLQFDNVFTSHSLREPYPYPYGTAAIAPDIISGQQYDVQVELAMPRTSANKDAGNFMLEVNLLAPHEKGSNGMLDAVKDGLLQAGAPATDPRQSLARSRRSTILPYRSYGVELAYKLSELHWYLLSFRSEAEKLNVPMFERVEFGRGWRNVPAFLKVEIQSTHQLQIYSAKAVFRARFTGLRWLMYNHRLSTATVFIFTFWATEMVFAAVAWGALTLFLAGSEDDMEVKGEEIHEVAKHVKEEKTEDERRQLSETERTFPSLTGQPSVRYSEPPIKQEEIDEPSLLPEAPSRAVEADDEDEDGDFFIDSGIGTSLESGSSRRDSIRRRRSQKGSRYGV
ncbi:hypothetical protein K431DRAFT_288866 [Polychaeton citri CBS 116435]|uniref:Adipose-regulatory protein n=1 Tax=Polychaeton citri CBS 116435 TaxID=1314669 RepID=A0A9P4UK40_9PEZI|nr:hypothetical protein K431DRAFT_288866 [Polychaeton citri CBS 116435]